MRRALIAIAVAAGLGGVAHAGDAAEVDLSAFEDRLVVLGDDGGHVLVLAPYDSDVPIFFGDGKVMHEQHVIGAGGSPGEGHYSYRLWSPTVASHAGLQVEGGEAWTVTCGERVTGFRRLDGAAAKEIVDHASFRGPLWQRHAYALARDDRGRYYYVDLLRGGRYGFRLFVGKRGAMKELRLRDVVSDSEGDLLLGRRGKLRLDGGVLESKRRATWIEGKRRVSLRSLPVDENRVLIYRDLGVYRGVDLGSVCDEL